MKTVFLLLTVAAAVLAVIIQQPNQIQLSTSRKALQFNNFTGSGARPEHIAAFLELASSASALYKDNVEANARYIKEGLDSRFGTSNQNFFVVIQTEEKRFSWLLWTTSENLIASLSEINDANPQWSYLFLKYSVPPTSANYVFISQGDKGSGVTSEIEAFISNSVATYQQNTDQCTCNDYETMTIGYDLINRQEGSWNTLCSATPGMYAYVYTVEGLWIHTKPKNCYYIFYVSQK